jgi:hypothetical protein
MSNGNSDFERLWKVQTSINKLILDGRRDAGAVADVLQRILDGGSLNSFLNLIDSAVIALTKGDVTIAKASDVFTGYIDPNFKKWDTDVAGKDTIEQMVDIHEMKKGGTYTKLFGSLSANRRSLCHSQGQIVEFCRTNPHLLRQDGFGTFFLFEVNGEVFVAHVHVGGGRLEVYVNRSACALILCPLDSSINFESSGDFFVFLPRSLLGEIRPKWHL